MTQKKEHFFEEDCLSHLKRLRELDKQDTKLLAALETVFAGQPLSPDFA
jgi:hypothetical protein